MAGRADHALTPEEAKERLRRAGRGSGEWMRRHAWGVLAMALAAGLVAGRSPLSSRVQRRLLERLLSMAVAMVLAGRR